MIKKTRKRTEEKQNIPITMIENTKAFHRVKSLFASDFDRSLNAVMVTYEASFLRFMIKSIIQ